MLQVIQNYNTGELKVDNVPVPTIQPGGILVRTMYSLISAGTERTTVETAQKSLVGKAKSRPDLVKKVLQVAKRDGILATLQLVKNKLDTPVPLGYSSAGYVVAVGEGVTEFAVGDRVACAGQGYASHSEVVYVPINLAVKVPEQVPLDEAAYATLGAIALQGIRQSEVTVGDNVAVIGLGLLGLLTVQMLKSAGCRVVGFDINPNACARAKSMGADYALSPADDMDAMLQKLTRGYGVDSAIITAATSGNEPIILAGDICRNKGNMVIVGAVPANVPRSPFYEKEIDVRFSRSYGPGRYDVKYEEGGIDYPYGYVRWTENRNMQAFLDLIDAKKIDLQSVTTHRFKIEDAIQAYDLITGKSKTKEPHIGLLLTYDHRTPDSSDTAFQIRESSEFPPLEGRVRIGFIGAGSFAQNYLLPHLKKNKRVQLIAVATSKGVTSSGVAKKFKFREAASDDRSIATHTDIDTVFIATRHHQHADQVNQCLRKGKSVFVEKPLALNMEQLQSVIDTHNQTGGRVMVGFNRRFSPTIQEVRKFFDKKVQPAMIHYRINAGFVPKEHWTQDAAQGGGRIIGEVCHFVDLIMYLTGSLPIKVYADTISSNLDSLIAHDNVSITFKFRDGSIGTIEYVAVGDKSFPKERIEMYCENSVAVIDDFKKCTLTRNGKTKTFGGSKQEKGYKQCVESFIGSIQSGQDAPIPLRESVNAMIATFKILESLQLGRPVDIVLDDRQDFLSGLSRIYTDHLKA